jgi:transcriptional regulator with PAS, ATPase and Fis domain
LGLIEVAEEGTLYLNEIADASELFQTKLLDVLETKKIRRLGETSERKVDFRLIAATNHDLEQMVRENKFRADLYHRLNEIPILLPALSERTEDIPHLLEYFLEKCDVAITGTPQQKEKLITMLLNTDWPGNVREFKSQIERMALISDGDLGRMIEIAARSVRSERDQLEALLSETNWNRSQVAKILGISEGTVRHRIKKYRLSN